MMAEPGVCYHGTGFDNQRSPASAVSSSPPNRLIYADDCLNVLKSESAIPSESVDLIYLDPPFNSKSKYNLPFKGELRKDAGPVEAFKDTWHWGEFEEEKLAELKSGMATKPIAGVIEFARMVNQEAKPSKKISTGAYLLNMAIRLEAMKRVLKKTGTIYLHCDPTASHYLKLIMDALYGRDGFRNEIIWQYFMGGKSTKDFARKHDVILRYVAGSEWTFHRSKIKRRLDFIPSLVDESVDAESGKDELGYYSMVHCPDVWQIKSVFNMSKEYKGYPTQKPLALLERIIEASSNPGDMVLDPFCGCGTAIHAAERLGRRWMGVDISTFAAGLMRERIISNFEHISAADIQVNGVPRTIEDAKRLAKNNPFEFEKWICGQLGAHGMFHEPGTKGSDGGVDGVLNFGLYTGLNEKVELGYALVQVKGGKVTPDAVRALTHSVREYEARAGILVCFEEHMGTVENNRLKETFGDLTGTYPVIQGFSVERLLNNERPSLPPLLVRGDARLAA